MVKKHLVLDHASIISRSELLDGWKLLHLCVFRQDGVIVDYAVTVVVDGAGVSTEQLDYLTLQSNRVENSYREVVERSTVAHAIAEVQNVVTEALQNEEEEAESGKMMTLNWSPSR